MLLAVVLVSVCGFVQALLRIDPLVSTKLGLIQGLQSKNGDYAKFLGVPYGVVDKENPFGPSAPYPHFDNIFEAYEERFKGVENIITDLPLNIKSTKVANIPVIIGNNDNESAFQYARENTFFFLSYSIGEVLDLSSNLIDDVENVVDVVRNFYIGDENLDDNVRSEITNFASDFIYHHPTQEITQQFLENGATNVYRYIFSYSGGRNIMKLLFNLNVTGAVHADELGYLFDLESVSGETSSKDQLVVDRITKLWTNFAKYGNPVPATSELLPVTWEPVTINTQPYLDINSSPDFKARPFTKRMAFWDVFFKLYRKIPEAETVKENIARKPACLRDFLGVM